MARQDKTHLTVAVIGGLGLWLLLGAPGTGQRLAFPPPPPPLATDEMSPDDFAGSQACADYHRDQYQAWSNSTHGRAGGPPGPNVLIAPFDGTPIRFKDATVTPSVTPEGSYLFTVERPERDPDTLSVDGVVGGGHMVGGGTQGFVSRFPDGTVRFLPFDFARQQGIWFCNTATIEGWWTHSARPRPDQGWVPITEQMALADCGDWPPVRVLGTNTTFANCQQCHGSQITVEFDLNARRYETGYTTLQINCESCHGPAAAHVTQARAGTLSQSSDLGVRELGTLGEDASVSLCLECHALKRSLAPGYLPGERFEEHYSLRAPAVSDRPYLPDGRVGSFGYQQNHVASSCYLDGAMTCVDCHDPHAQNYRDAFGSALNGRFDDGQCTACHASKAVDPSQHTNHSPESDGARCVACHMPYLQHPNVGDRISFARSDHTIPIPRPAFDTQLGLETACAQCHADRPVDELQRQVDAWYGEIKPHKDIVSALTRTRNGRAQPSDVRALLAPGTVNPLIQTSALHEFVIRYLSPDMPEIDPAIQDSLVGLTTNRDLDVRSFALAALHLARGEDASVRPFLVNTLANAEEDLLTRTRWIWALRHYGDRYLNGGNPARAAAAYAKALELQSDHPGIISDLASAFAATGDHETALQYFELSLTIDPSQPTLLVNMAVSLEQLGRLEDAITAYDQATNLDPGASLAHFNLGNIHFQQGEYRQAIDRYSQAVSHSPDLSTANLLLAQSYLLVNRPDSALMAVRRALEFDPSSDAGLRMLRDLTNDR